jgi:ATP-dependent 26S proteasome regulatory subunit
MHFFLQRLIFCLRRGINLRKIAEQMTGSSGAEVKGVCTEAGKCFFLYPKSPSHGFSK